MPTPSSDSLPVHWQTRSTHLRTQLARLEADDSPEARWAANHARRELALLDGCLESVHEDGPEYALCIGCGTATKDPEVKLVAQRGEEADIELVGGGQEVREWPVPRRKPTGHLWFNRFVVCAVCEEARTITGII